MCAEDVLPCFLLLPVIAVPNRAEAASFVDGLDGLQVLVGGVSGLGVLRVVDEERVVHVACRVLLRLEECVEVPERRLDVVVCRHFLKAHLEEDLTEFIPDLRERMAVARLRDGAECVRVQRFEEFGFPSATSQHLLCQLGFGLFAFLKVAVLLDLVVNSLALGNQFALLQHNEFLLLDFFLLFHSSELSFDTVLDIGTCFLNHGLSTGLVQGNPFALECVGKSRLIEWLLFEFVKSNTVGWDDVENANFSGSFFERFFSGSCQIPSFNRFLSQLDDLEIK